MGFEKFFEVYEKVKVRELGLFCLECAADEEGMLAAFVPHVITVSISAHNQGSP